MIRTLREKRVELLGIALFVGLVVGVILTKAPWWDEGYFAGPAKSLAAGGPLGSHALSTEAYQDGDKFLYWSPPLYFIVLAAAFKVVGFSIYTQRALSLLWGVVFLIAWRTIAHTLFGSRTIAWLAIVLLGTDSVVILAASEGRMDMMTAALGAVAFGSYLRLREENLHTAVAAGSALASAAALTHPLGLIHAGGLLVAAVYLDRRRFGWRHLGLAVAPALLFAAGWAAYILQNPELFRDQIAANAARRAGLFRNPLQLLLTDFVDRYLRYYFWNPTLSGVLRLKGILLFFYLAGPVAAAWVAELRRQNSVRLLLWVCAVEYVLLALGDNQRFWTYFIHVFPVWLLLLAVACDYWLRRAVGGERLLAGVCVAGGIALQLGAVAFKIEANPFQSTYRPLASYLLQNTSSEDRIMGNVELLFALGSDERLYEGMRPELYREQPPEWIVVHKGGYGYSRLIEPDRYNLRFGNSEYLVYSLKTAP